MTFIINRDGVLLQKDLGKATTEAAAAMTEFDSRGIAAVGKGTEPVAVQLTHGLLENRFTARVFCRARRNPSRIVVVSLIPWRSSRPNPFLDRQQSRVERVGVGTRDDPFQ